MATLRRTIIEAIEAAPCSERALARAARLSHTTLQGIRSGERPPTRETAEAVADALERMGDACIESAHEIRRSIE